MTKIEQKNLNQISDGVNPISEHISLPQHDNSGIQEQLSLYPSSGMEELSIPDKEIKPFSVKEIAQEAHRRLQSNHREFATNPDYNDEVRAEAREFISSLTIVSFNDAQSDYLNLEHVVDSFMPDNKYSILIVEDFQLLAAALPDTLLVSKEFMEAHRDNPDILAGVLAHEIAHIELNHSFIIKPTLSDPNRSARGQLFETLVEQYMARVLEVDADIAAGKMLESHGISTAPFKDFLNESFENSFQEKQRELETVLPAAEAKSWSEMLHKHPHPDRRKKFIE